MFLTGGWGLRARTPLPTPRALPEIEPPMCVTGSCCTGIGRTLSVRNHVSFFSFCGGSIFIKKKKGLDCAIYATTPWNKKHTHIGPETIEECLLITQDCWSIVGKNIARWLTILLVLCKKIACLTLGVITMFSKPLSTMSCVFICRKFVGTLSLETRLTLCFEEDGWEFPKSQFVYRKFMFFIFQK